MATIQDLVEFLRDTASDLEYNYDSSTPLKMSSNTYRMSQHILGTDEGFVDLNDPVDKDAEMEWPKPDEEEEEDDEEMLEEKKEHPEERDECFLGLNEEDELDEYGRSYRDVAEEGLNEYTDNEMDEGKYSESILKYINAGHYALADNNKEKYQEAIKWLWDHMGQMDSKEREMFNTLKDMGADGWFPEETGVPEGFEDFDYVNHPLKEGEDEGEESVEDWINKGHFALADNDEDGIRAALEWLETHEDIMNPEEQEEYKTLKDMADGWF